MNTVNQAIANFSQDDDMMTQAELWEQQLDMMGHRAPVEELRSHLAIAPIDAPSREALALYLAGVDGGVSQAA